MVLEEIFTIGLIAVLATAATAAIYLGLLNWMGAFYIVRCAACHHLTFSSSRSVAGVLPALQAPGLDASDLLAAPLRGAGGERPVALLSDGVPRRLARVAHVDAFAESPDKTELLFLPPDVHEPDLAVTVAGRRVGVGDVELEFAVGRLRDDALDEFGGDALAPGRARRRRRTLYRPSQPDSGAEPSTAEPGFERPRHLARRQGGGAIPRFALARRGRCGRYRRSPRSRRRRGRR